MGVPFDARFKAASLGVLGFDDAFVGTTAGERGGSLFVIIFSFSFLASVVGWVSSLGVERDVRGREADFFSSFPWNDKILGRMALSGVLFSVPIA